VIESHTDNEKPKILTTPTVYRWLVWLYPQLADMGILRMRVPMGPMSSFSVKVSLVELNFGDDPARL